MKENKFQKECPICGTLFSTKRENSTYCSNACKHKAHNKRVTLQCQFCSKDYLCQSTLTDRSKYCCIKCKQEANKVANSILKPCDKCGKEIRVINYDLKHHSNHFCSADCANSFRATSWEEKALTAKPKADGYVYVYDPTRKTKTGGNKSTTVHKLVMEKYLGRELTPDESVHHKNGNRADNRIENLELWSKNQPAGQRVEDKVAWAFSILKLYVPEILERI